MPSKLRNGYARTIHGKMKITIAVAGVRLRWNMFTKQVSIPHRRLKLSGKQLALSAQSVDHNNPQVGHAIDKQTCANISQAHHQFSLRTCRVSAEQRLTPYLLHYFRLESPATRLPKTFPTRRFSRIDHAPVDRFGHKGHRKKYSRPPTIAASAHESTRDRYSSWRRRDRRARSAAPASRPGVRL